MKKFLLVSLMLVFPLAVYAQEAPALPYLAIDRNPATLATGAAQAVSGLYNPAAIPFTGSDIMLSYQSWAPSVAKSAHFNLMGAVKLGKKAGLHFYGGLQKGEEYSITDEGGSSVGSFKPSDLLFGAGFGYAVSRNWSLGGDLLIARSKLSPSDAVSSFGANLFVLYSKGALKASAGVANLGLPVSSGDKSYPVPSSAKAGADYGLAFGSCHLDFRADFDLFFSGGLRFGGGAQFDWNDMVFVRGGYHFATQKAPVPSFAAVGAGFKIAGFHLDAAFLLASPALGKSLTIGLGYAF